MSISPQEWNQGFQRLPSLNYYNYLLHRYIRTMVGLLFDSPTVLPRYITRPSLELAVVLGNNIHPHYQPSPFHCFQLTTLTISSLFYSIFLSLCANLLAVFSLIPSFLCQPPSLGYYSLVGNRFVSNTLDNAQCCRTCSRQK